MLYVYGMVSQVVNATDGRQRHNIIRDYRDYRNIKKNTPINMRAHHTSLTSVEIDGKLFQLVALDDRIDQLATERAFRLNGHRQRRVQFDVLGHRVRVELLAEDGHGFVDDLE